MDPLITIETVPISIEYVEKKTAHVSNQSASLRFSQENNRLTIQSNPIDITPVDTFEYGSPIDLHNLSYTATAQYSNDGSLSMNVRMGNYDAGTFNYDQVNRGIDNIVSFLPQVQSTPKPSSGLESIQIDFDMSHVSALPPVDNIDTSFLPPDLELKVVERPKVIIKYVGGPLYIPRSADPEYVPPEEFNQIFDGKPNIDIKA
ncbi:hypothetical protein SDC9_163645 [bioreactor metagenome]|uniref:Uncharacterized protein n=1 Tax=bioreactor metagenome TaxID=1076179 RepID=A0A645FRF8_9ZZZZ